MERNARRLHTEPAATCQPKRPPLAADAQWSTLASAKFVAQRELCLQTTIQTLMLRTGSQQNQKLSKVGQAK